LQAYLKFEKNQITFETRRQIVDAAKNYMLKDKKDIGFKILSYASGIHARET
jgi:methionine synthase II (cobalamin-independent)